MRKGVMRNAPSTRQEKKEGRKKTNEKYSDDKGA